MSLILAVDGGNSKTDLALVSSEGEALALVRGPASSPQYLGAEGCVDVLDELLGDGVRKADLRRNSPVAEVAKLLLAGVDFPDDEREVEAAAQARGWAARTTVANDTFAVLRAGTDRGWGVAVVCGSGINCVGVAPDGRHARFPSLGAITGDWGGGYDVGLAAVVAAARSEDGRGEETSLEQAVPAHFGVDTPRALAEAVHRKEIERTRFTELAPVVFAAASEDPVAAAIVDRLATEIAALARVALERLDLTQQSVEVLLGGGLVQTGDGRLLDAVRLELERVAPAARVEVTASAPIVGAVLLALDEVGASEAAKARARDELASRASEEA